MNPYNLEKRRRGRVAKECECHEPKLARRLAEKAVPYPGSETEAIVIAAGKDSKCEPFLVIQKDAKRFAACNKLADKIGPLDDPEKAYQLIEDFLLAEVNEVFGLITLDLHLRMKSIALTGRGEPSAVMAPLIPTLQVALIDGAHYVILWHCHPSGIEAEPSDADKETTEAFARAFEQISGGRDEPPILLDHLIAGGTSKKRSFFSFSEAGLLDDYYND